MNRKIRKTIKRTVSLLIVMVMIAGVFPISVLADGLNGNETQAAAGYSDTEENAEDQSDVMYYQEIPDSDTPAEEDETGISDDIDTEDDQSGVSLEEADNTPEDGSDEEVIDAEEDPASEGALAAPATDGEIARLSITRDETDFPSGTSYVMEKTQNQGFLVNYRYSNLENVVLVIDCLDIGADFAAIPEKNEFFNEAVLLEQGKMAIRLTTGADKTDCTIGFLMKHVGLTDEQVLELIDSEVLPTARIAATEYTLPKNSKLKNVLTEGTKGEECVLWEGTPYYNPDATVSVTKTSSYSHSYKVTVSPVSNENISYTNIYLDKICTYDKWTKIFNGYKNGAPRFDMPGAYNDGGALMEIVSIRFYEPTDLVRLKGIAGPGTDINNTTDLLRSSYNLNWGDWTVGERTFDPDKNAYFYDLTPPARVFNANTIGMTQLLAGMTLKWTLADTSDALAPGTSYLAENTQITFRLPGDGQKTRTAEVRGPEIITGTKEYIDLRTTYPSARIATYTAKQDISVGKKYTNIEFTSIYNGIQDTATKTYYPNYDGPVTQEYDFPYQIEPLKIRLNEHRQSLMDPSERPVLVSIAYTTWDDDTWIYADQSVVDAINSGLAITTGDGGGSYEFPEEVRVKKVRVNWSRLSIWDYPGEADLLYTYFDIEVNHCTDETCSDHLPQAVQVQVKYREYYDSVFRDGEYIPPEMSASMLLPGQTEASVQNVEAVLWFRLICQGCQPKVCPELIGQGKDNSEAYFNSGKTASVGDVGFEIGTYETRYDSVHDPEITLKLKKDTSGAVGSTNLVNITNDQMIAFFTGEFTAMPRLSGWTFNYSAENKEHDIYTNSVTIPEITDEKGVKDCWLPLPDGYAFTSVKLSYSGDFDLSHDDENDTKTVIWLMKDLIVHRNDEIPFLDKKVHVEVDHLFGCIMIGGSVTFDISELADENGPHCKCGQHITGKAMKYTSSSSIPRVHVRNNRQAKFSLTCSMPEPATIYQGEGVGDSSAEDNSVTWDLNGKSQFTADDYTLFREVGWDPSFLYEDIHEAIYVELTDEEFMPDLDHSMLWGYPVSGQNIQSEIIVVYDDNNQPHRFLKLEFVDGFIRTKSYEKTQGATEYSWKDKGIQYLNPQNYFNSTGNNVLHYNGHIHRDGNVTGPFRLAFKTVAGTTIGEHHPVGMIYYDLSDIIRNYNASIKTPEEELSGYDDNHTLYLFTGNNVVTDNMGLTGDNTSSLFYQDGSSWTVKVLLHQETGASYDPGKNMTYYDDVYHFISFTPGEEEDLNALWSLTGPGDPLASSIYDVTSITVLPRKGKTIKYMESQISSGTQVDVAKVSPESDMDFYLRGAPTVIGNNTNVVPLFTYTTAEDPLADGTVWVNADSISDWNTVTGIKLVMGVMDPKTSVNIRLDLKTDVKSENYSLYAYSGGNFKYRLTKNGGFIDPQSLDLCEWRYDSYIIEGFVFWDTYDENGIYTSYRDSNISGVKLTLYDPSGNVIRQKDNYYSWNPETETDFEDGSIRSGQGGNFVFYSNCTEDGQYIVIDFPETKDGSTPKLTSVSSEPYMMIGNDSDFDRETNTLVLGKLDPRFGYNKVSAGFIKLPEIQAADIEMYTGDTVSADAVIKEYVNNNTYNGDNILTNGTYKIEYLNIDESIATLDQQTGLSRSDDSSLKSTYTFTGIHAGSFKAEAVLTNRVGDTVRVSFNVTVKEREDIVVVSTWDDDDNRDGIRPDGITVQLMKNGVAEGDPVELNDANSNTYTWPNMIRFDDKGDEIDYTLSVTPIAEVAGHTGYTQTVDKSSYIADLTATAGGYKFTVNNVHIPEKVDLTVSKVWNDNNNSDGIRPASIEVELSDGTKAELNEGNNWKFIAVGKYKYENGKEIKYTWKEVNVPDGYTLTVSESGYNTTLTNSHKSVEDIVVTSTWDDDNNRDGIRPDGVTVQLMKNGVAEGDPVVLNDANSNTYTWSKMTWYDDNGKEVEYTLSVTPIADVEGHTGYTQTVDKSGYIAGLTATAGGYKFTVKNIHEPEKVTRTVIAVWIDNDNIDGIRPGKLDVELSQGSTVTINAGNSWTYIFTGLYKYENGKLKDYSWIAPAVPEGYSFSQTVKDTVTTFVYVHERVNNQPTPVAKTNTPLPSTGEGIATRTYLAAIFLIVSCGMGVMALRGFRKKEE